MIPMALLFPCTVHPLLNTPMVNSRLVHSCVALSQRISHYEPLRSSSIPKQGLSKTKHVSPTITKHRDLIARLHAKCRIYIELHAWSFAVSGVGKMSCCLLSPRKRFHVIDQWQYIDITTILEIIEWYNCTEDTQGQLNCSPRTVHHETTSRETFTSSRGRRGGMLQQSLKPLLMTHTKSTIIVVHCSHM